MDIKHYTDIENLRETDINLNSEITRVSNDGAFTLGDIISITEKVDGSNASFRYDTETNSLVAFSRNKELNFQNTLNGFWNYVQNLDANEYSSNPDYIVFGEWLIKNKIVYNDEAKRKFYVFDIYNVTDKTWKTPEEVKAFCNEHNLIYVHELYYGEFKGWDHVRTFCHNSAYGNTQEGVVVRNVSKLNKNTTEFPTIIKIVNDEFKETHKIKTIDPNKENEKQHAYDLISSIVTTNRVEKMILKLQEEGDIKKELTSKDLGDIARILPKKIYEDCLKEEPEIVKSAGEHGGKCISGLVMKIVRELIVGT